MPKGDPGLFVSYCAKDFLDGTQLLDPWEELAYRRICDMIYATNDRLPDDDRKLAWMTKVGRRWPAIKATLTGGERPKLIVVDGRITNIRCQEALGTAAQSIAQKGRAGAASAATGKSLKNLKQHRTADRSPVRTADRTELRTNLESTKPLEKDPLTWVQKGGRLVADFKMPAEWLEEGAQAREKANLPPVDLATEAIKFCNHWWSKSGKDATKISWHQTWINWSLNARGAGNGRRQSAHDSTIAAFDLVSR